MNAPVSGPAPKCPFVGLIPFREEDWRYFFGRDGDGTNILTNLLGRRLTLLYGPSGAGKSSVLNALVINRIRKLKPLSGELRSVPIVYNSWSLTPARGLVVEISKALDIPPGEEAKDDKLASQKFASFIRRVADEKKVQLCLILDQFEEFFLYHPVKQAQESPLLMQLVELIRDPDAPVNIVFSLREDGLAKLDAFKSEIPAIYDSSLRLDYLTAESAKAAINGPLKQFTADTKQGEYAVEPELENELLSQTQVGLVTVSDAAQGRAAKVTSDLIETPYLQLVLTRLWEEELTGEWAQLGPKDKHSMHLETLKKLGGAEGIVRTHLQRLLDQKLPETERAIMAALARYLVTPDQGKVAQSEATLTQYASALLTAEQQKGIGPLLEKLTTREFDVLRRVKLPSGDRFEVFHDTLGKALVSWRVDYDRKQAERAAILKEESDRETRIAKLKVEEDHQADLTRIRAEEAKKAEALRLELGKGIAILLSAAALVIGLAFWKLWNLSSQRKQIESQLQMQQTQMETLKKQGEEQKLSLQAQLKEERETQEAKLEKKRTEYETTAAAQREQLQKQLDERTQQSEALKKTNDELSKQNDQLKEQSAAVSAANDNYQKEIKEFFKLSTQVRNELGQARTPTQHKLFAALDDLKKTATTSASQLNDATAGISKVTTIIGPSGWRTGKAQVWGGPDNTGPWGSTLAFITSWKRADATDVFRPNANRSKPPRAEDLNPDAYYMAARWDYTKTPPDWLIHHKVRVKNPKTGVELEAQPVEWGPPEKNGELMAISPGLAKDLGVQRLEDVSYLDPNPDLTAPEAVPSPDLPAPKPPITVPPIRDHRTQSVPTMPGLYIWIGKINSKTQVSVPCRIFKSSEPPADYYKDTTVDSQLAALPGIKILARGNISKATPLTFALDGQSYILEVSKFYSGLTVMDRVDLQLSEKGEQ